MTQLRSPTPSSSRTVSFFPGSFRAALNFLKAPRKPTSQVSQLRTLELPFPEKPQNVSQRSTQTSCVSSPNVVSPGASSILACPILAGPTWTPPHYESLAETGYTKNVIVFRCITLIARSLGSLPFTLSELREDGHLYTVDKHPLLDLLRMPNLRQSGSVFVEEAFSQLLLSGNVYIRATLGLQSPSGSPTSHASNFPPPKPGERPPRDSVSHLLHKKREYAKTANTALPLPERLSTAASLPSQGPLPEQLDILRSDRVSILIDSEGRPTGFEVQASHGKKTYPCDPNTGESLILHIRTFHPLNDWYGLSPIEAASRSIDQHNAVGEHNLAILQNGGRPSGALIVRPAGGTLTQQQREELRRSLRQLYEGPGNAGRMFVLEGNCEWRDMGFSPKDLDFQAGKNLSAREIALAFGVPPILIGLTEDATFSNYKEARLNFWEETLLPLFDRFIAELNRWLVPCYGKNLRLGYDKDEIAALAFKREVLWDKIQSASFLTINEKRQAVGYDPIEGGDRLDSSQASSVATQS